MKNIKVLSNRNFSKLLMLFFLFFFSACNKSDLLNRQVESELQIFNDLSIIEDVSSRKIAYAQLSVEERFELWKYRFTKLIESEKYNRIQKQLFRDLNNKISLSVFVDGSDEKEIFHNVLFIDWLKEAVSYFEEEELRNTVFSIPSQNGKEVSLLVQEPEKEMCICSTTSAYSCWHIEVSWPPAIGYGDCSGGGCIEERGCGALWDLNCDGSICSF